LAGIEHIAALDHKVEFIIGPIAAWPRAMPPASSANGAAAARNWRRVADMTLLPCMFSSFCEACAGELGASIGGTRGWTCGNAVEATTG
jgi:hypothetical protein